MPDRLQESKGADSPFFCYTVGIAPEEGARHYAAARLVEMTERSRWLVTLRWAAAAGLALAATVARWGLLLPVPVAAVYALAAALAAYNVVFHALARREISFDNSDRQLSRARAIATVQIVADLAVLTALLHLTGGIENPFFFYFVFHMIIASILLTRAASFYIASLATGLFFALVLSEHYGFVGHRRLWPFGEALYENGAYVFAVLTVFATTMYLAVYFAGDIVEKLRATTRDLSGATASLELGTLQLRDAFDKIRALEEKKSDFLRTAAHQLRSPLSAVRSLLDVILGGFAGDAARQEEMLRRARERADLMLVMVSDLLALSQLKDPDAARPEPAERVDVCALIGEIEALYRPKAAEKGVRLAAACPAVPHAVLASADDVRQVLTNLMDNAINYTPAGGSVDCAVTAAGGTVSIAVRDTGIGIAPEDAGRVFEEFYRAPNAKKAHALGTGLGLAIVKRTVEKWNGSVAVESRPHEGTTFTITLPSADVA